MKWAKCIYNTIYLQNHNVQSNRLTVGKIYEVLEYNYSKYNESIIVINDKHERSLYYTIGWFEDATSEVRDNKLNKILEYERYIIEVS